jgi:hypothetical protein
MCAYSLHNTQMSRRTAGRPRSFKTVQNHTQMQIYKVRKRGGRRRRRREREREREREIQLHVKRRTPSSAQGARRVCASTTHRRALTQFSVKTQHHHAEAQSAPPQATPTTRSSSQPRPRGPPNSFFPPFFLLGVQRGARLQQAAATDVKIP